MVIAECPPKRPETWAGRSVPTTIDHSVLSERGLSNVTDHPETLISSWRWGAMPRYFFDIHDGDGPQVDKAGVVLVDDDAARDEATVTIAELGKELLPQDGSRRVLTIRVRREDGTPLLNVRLDFSIEG